MADGCSGHPEAAVVCDYNLGDINLSSKASSWSIDVYEQITILFNWFLIQNRRQWAHSRESELFF